MLKYRSKCKWNLLLYINDKVVEVRPNEEFVSSHEVISKYLELIIEESDIQSIKKKNKEKVNEPINNSEA